MNDNGAMAHSETELRFIAPDIAVGKIKQMAVLCKMTQFTDEYFDLPRYPLMKNNMWLRTRNGVLELKVGTSHSSTYIEHTNPQSISNILHIQKLVSAKDLAVAGYTPIAKFTTSRAVYELEGTIICCDTVDFIDYAIVEIELAQGEYNTSNLKKIRSVASSLGLTQSAENKILLYFRAVDSPALTTANKVLENAQ